MKKKKKGLKIFLIVLTILLVLFGLGLIILSPYLYVIKGYRANAMAIAATSTKDDFRSTESSIIYDVNGEEIATVNSSIELYYISSSKIPDVVMKAFIILEDRKFYTHDGIDIYAIIRSALTNLRTGTTSQGASTITQQVARNVYLTQEVSYERKITEMFLAMELEKKYSKDEILEFYVNNIYYANGYYGIEAAANGYFDRSVTELTLSELIFLTAIPKNPSKYDPISHYDKAVDRRDYILGLLKKAGYITEPEYYEAISQEIVITRGRNRKVDYVETYVYYCATRSLMAKEGFVFRNEFLDEKDKEQYEELYDEAYSRHRMSLYTGGFRIYTSIDMDAQNKLQEVVNEALSEFDEKTEDGIYKMQGSAVCINNATGFVTAIVGGRDQGLPGYTLNRAYQSYRQPGSSIKPLIVYAPFLGLGHNPSYVVDDSYFEGGPTNFEGRYPGESTLTEALAWSSNVVAWKLYEQITPEYGMSFLKKMNFRKTEADERYMSACLGGWTYGTSSLEIASAYATLANDGFYREPTAVMRITDSKKHLLVDNTRIGESVYDYNAARMISKMLQYGVEEGLAVNAGLNNAIVAVKTGTTTNNKDGWTAGYSRYYTTAVWVGYDLPKTVENLTGGTYPLTIWHDFMEYMHEGLKIEYFLDYTEFDDKSQANSNGGGAGGSGGGSYSGGDIDATGAGGDVDAPTGGDADANHTGGDSDARETAGDTDSNHKGGDTDANHTGGDSEAPSGGGDSNANIPGSGADADANHTGGDVDASGYGDKDAPAGGDADAPTGGDVDAPGW